MPALTFDDELPVKKTGALTFDDISDQSDMLRSGYRSVMNNIAKPINNAVSAGIGYLANGAGSVVTPQGKQAFNTAADYIKNSPPGIAIGEAYQQAKDEVNDLAQYNPNLKPDLEALGQNVQLAGNAPILKPVADVAGSALKTAAKPIAEGIGLRAKGFSSMKPEELASISENNWGNASAALNQAHSAGAVLKPDAAQKILGDVKSAIGSLNGRHSDTLAELRDFETAVNTGSLTLNKLDEFRQNFGDVISDNTKSKIDGGGLNSDGYKALQAKNAIMDSFGTLEDGHFSAGNASSSQLLKQGVEQYAQAHRFDRVVDLLNKSEDDSNAIQRNFKSFVSKDSNLRGYSAEEVSLLKDIAERGLGQKLERGLGTFGLDLGKTKNIALPVITAGSNLAIPGGAPLAIAGTIARQTGKLAARGKAQRAIDEIMRMKPSEAKLRKPKDN